MFDAPVIIREIPDIVQIYRTNDRQITELDAAMEKLENNILPDTMSQEMLEKWEKLLKLFPRPDDSLDDRRMSVKRKILERLPYSYRVIRRRLKELCENGFRFWISDDRTEIEVTTSISSERQMEIIEELLENLLPLNVSYELKNNFSRRIGGSIYGCGAVVSGATQGIATRNKTVTIGTSAYCAATVVIDKKERS